MVGKRGGCLSDGHLEVRAWSARSWGQKLDGVGGAGGSQRGRRWLPCLNCIPMEERVCPYVLSSRRGAVRHHLRRRGNPGSTMVGAGREALDSGHTLQLGELLGFLLMTQMCLLVFFPWFVCLFKIRLFDRQSDRAMGVGEIFHSLVHTLHGGDMSPELHLSLLHGPQESLYSGCPPLLALH